MTITHAPDALKGSIGEIFTRLWLSEKGLSKTDAKRIMKLRFRDEDIARMDELSLKNKSGTISKWEWEELENFLTVGNWLAQAQLKARRVLQPRLYSRKPHG